MDQVVTSGTRGSRRTRLISGMRGLVAAFVALAAGLLAAPGDAAAPPAEAFGALPAETDVVLSPDGHWLAWMDHKEAKPHVVMFDVSARTNAALRAARCAA